jgi:predicted GH43/DUF377 family glycosyl hydrolase
MCSLFKRYEGNPILTPNPKSLWDSYMVFNAAAIYVGDKFHLLYRARGRKGGVSKLGYVSSIDGFHIDERLNKPVFEPEPENELESYGCEDPRLVEIEDKIYLTYTAYGRIPGLTPSLNIIQIAMTNITTEDFIQKKWNWGPRYYPFPKVDNKHACIFPEKINGRWVMYHRIPPHIWIAYSDDLKSWGETSIVLSPRKGWNDFKIGGGAPPIKTEEGWLIIYHAVDREWNYWLEAAVADLNRPQKIIKRGDDPILKPEEEYEVKGDVPNTIFTCGAVLRDDTVYLYYSGADTVMCVATANIHELLESLKKI